MRASPALFNRFRAEHVNPSNRIDRSDEARRYVRRTIVAMVPTARGAGRGHSEHRRWTIRGRAAAPQCRGHDPPLTVHRRRSMGVWRRRSPLTASTNHVAGKQITPAQQRFDVTDFESSSKSSARRGRFPEDPSRPAQPCSASQATRAR